MNISMRLFPRRHPSGKLIWYIEFDRGRRRSTNCEVGREDAEARRLYKLAKRDYLAGKLASLSDRPGRLLLADFAREYLEHGRRTNKAKATLTKDEQALRYFLAFAGGKIHLGAINRRLIESWLASLTRLKPVSRNTYFRHLKAALQKAVDWDYLKSNPCRGVRQLRDHEDPPRALSPGEVARLLAAEPDPRFRLLWEFYLASGCRRTEALNLTTQDIDRERGLILIRRTKTRRPRYLPLTPEIAALLDRLSVAVGRLFPWQPDTVTHHFHRSAQSAGLACRLHDLRHTYGTNTALQVPPWVLKTLLGHTDLKTTDRYVHLTPADLHKELKNE